MSDEFSVDQVLKERERASTRREAVCVPAEIVAVNLKTINVKQIVKPISYDEFDDRINIEPLDYEDVKYGAIGGAEASIFIPPKVGMRGLMFVTDYDVADTETGLVSQDRIRGRSSGYFIPILEEEYVTDLVFKNGAGGKLTLSQSGADLVGTVSLIAAVKQLNDVVKSINSGIGAPLVDLFTT